MGSGSGARPGVAVPEGPGGGLLKGPFQLGHVFSSQDAEGGGDYFLHQTDGSEVPTDGAGPSGDVAEVEEVADPKQGLRR